MTDNIKLTKLPEPDICHYVVTVWRDGVECEIDKGPRYTVEQMQAYAREAVRLNATVPDGWVLVPVEPTQQMKNAAQERCRAGSGMDWSGVTPQSLFGVAYKAMLSAAPQPAQPLTDEQANCWCESCDLAKGDPCGRTRMSICPNCGDKRCPRAKHHDNECQQAHGIGVKP